MNKKILAAIATVAIVIAGAYFYFAGKTYVLRISESEIREMLDRKLPLRETYLFIFEVTLKNPRVLLENGSNRVNAGLDILLNITVNDNPEPLGGTVDVSGGVIYLPENAQFFLTDPVVENLKVQGIPDRYHEKVNKALSQALGRYYAGNPIYILRATDAKKAVARMVLKTVVVENKELVITLGI